jgi:hypothetical protein
MDFIGMLLLHKTYGEGTVEAVSNGDTWKIFTVKYTDKTVALKYPDVFVQGIVAAADPAVQEAIMAEIEDSKKATLEEIERKMKQEREAAALAASKPGKAAKAVVSEPVEAIAENTPLTAGKKYGTASNRIYEACIPAFGFAPEGLKEFGWNNKMYARAATKEGHSVWMLAHSNWTDTKNEKWRNTISEGFRLITEDWGENAAGLEKEKEDEIRVTFAKDAAGVYVFLGVFKCTVIDSIKRIKKYELISDKYPTE